MKKISLFLVFLFLVVGTAGCGGYASMAQPGSGAQPTPTQTSQPVSISGTPVRIENEAKLVVPSQILEEVWQYMLERLVNDKSFIQSLDPSLDSYWYDELFTDVYYDTPDLAMLGRQSSVRYRTRQNLTDPTQIKSGRELLQIKLSDIDSNTFNRGEIKYNIQIKWKKSDPDSLHPVLGLINPSDRRNFKQVMAQLNIDPYLLKRILVLNQRRRSIYITHNGNAFISLRLDEVTSQMLWAKYSHDEIEPELNEIPYTAANQKTREYMQSIVDKIRDDIMQKFPEVKLDLTPKYNKAFNYFESQIPYLRYLIKNNFF